VTIGAGCTRKPTSRACGSSTAPSSRDTASGGWPGSATINCATSAGAGAPAARPAAVPTRPTPLDTTALLTALREYDAVGIDQELSRLAAVLRPLDLLQDVLMPVLTQVGDDWHGRRRASRTST
jgi:hypothetical protein